MLERSAIHPLLRVAPPKSCQPKSQSASTHLAKHTVANRGRDLGSYAYFNATMAKPFRWTMKGKPLVT